MPSRFGNPERRRPHFIKEWRDFRGYSQEKLGGMVGTIVIALFMPLLSLLDNLSK